MADVAWIQIGTALDYKDREYEVWIVNYRDGSRETIDPGDLWVMNGEDIVRRLVDRGIVVQ